MQTKLHRFTVNFPNKREYHLLKQEIFSQHLYEPQLADKLEEATRPLIIDAGAYLGLSTLYFNWLFPQAKIIAIEPHPKAFEYLEQNIFENNLETQVETFELALAESEGETKLYVDAQNDWLSTSSLISGAWTGTETTTPITVHTKPLSFFLEKYHEFTPKILKLDIEGAEWQVLKATGKKLQLIDEIILEFHPANKQGLKVLTEFLEGLNFKVTLEKNSKIIKNKYFGGLVLIRALSFRARSGI